MAFRGVFCAAATPIDTQLQPDHARLAAHAKRLLDEGCHGVALLGSTGEANSFSMAERKAMLESVVDAGVPADALMPGTGVPSVPETIDLTRHALSLGIKRVVVLPPFYYKNAADAGVVDFYSRVIDGVADDALEVVLYHIPQMSAVPITRPVIEALIAQFDSTIVGIKDSAGELEHMVGLARDFPSLSVFAGADPLMLPLLKAGGAGCITATSNVVAGALRTVFDNFEDAGKAGAIETAQEAIVSARNKSNSFVQIPTIKSLIAIKTGDDAWRRVRPPFVALTDDQIERLQQ